MVSLFLRKKPLKETLGYFVNSSNCEISHTKRRLLAGASHTPNKKGLLPTLLSSKNEHMKNDIRNSNTNLYDDILQVF